MQAFPCRSLLKRHALSVYSSHYHMMRIVGTNGEELRYEVHFFCAKYVLLRYAAMHARVSATFAFFCVASRLCKCYLMLVINFAVHILCTHSGGVPHQVF